MSDFLRPIVAIVLLQLFLGSAFPLTWGHLRNYEIDKKKYLSDWILDGRPIRYCIEMDGASASKELLSYYVEEGIKTWLDNETVSSCGTYNRKNELLDLGKIKFENISPPCNKTEEYLIISFGGRYDTAEAYYDSQQKAPRIRISGYSYALTKDDIKSLKSKTSLSSAEVDKIGNTAYRLLFHELGHAFGLCDQYMESNCSWLYRTNSLTASSAMFGLGSLEITYDDAIGLLTIFDRLSKKERIYADMNGTKKPVAMLDMIDHPDSTNLYIQCKDNSFKALMEKENQNLIFARAHKVRKSEKLFYAQQELKSMAPILTDYSKNFSTSVVNYKDKHGMTSLMWAAMRENKEGADIIEKLLSNGARADEKDNMGMTALMHAAQLDHHKAVSALLSDKDRASKIMDQTDNYGMTALMHAALSHGTKSLEILIISGADKSVKDDAGYTALDWAIMMELRQAVEILSR